LPFDTQRAEYYCQSNTFQFDDLVCMNIEKYIDEYIPKYICGFWNSKINGDIYIGTDDYGFIKGIPLSRSIDIPWLENKIRDSIFSSIKSEDGTPIEIHIGVEVVPIEKPKLQTGIHPLYQFYLEKQSEFIIHFKEFQKVYKEWQDTYELVNMKLVDIVNLPENRWALIDYMERNESKLNEDELKEYDIAMGQLVDNLYQLPALSGEDIKDLKNDKKSVFYWVTRLKDEMCIQYRKDKPYFFPKFKHRNIPYQLLIGMDMIPYWVDQVDLYMIRITSGLQSKSFLYNNGTQWIRCVRIIDDKNQPICLPE